MPQTEQLKTDLIAAINRAEPDGRYSEAHLDAVHALVNRLLPLTPLPRPADREDYVTGAWGTRFAQFGAKHTAGKPVIHETDFRILSFANLPKQPLRLLDLEQEIHHASKDYNNVHLIETLDSSFRATLIVFGRYRLDAENPQRYHVDFYKVAVRAPHGVSDAALRSAFGFATDQPLAVEFKPPRVHSDIVYCDADMRINFGSLGGVYVLNRLAERPGISVAFA